MIRAPQPVDIDNGEVGAGASNSLPAVDRTTPNWLVDIVQLQGRRVGPVSSRPRARFAGES